MKEDPGVSNAQAWGFKETQACKLGDACKARYAVLFQIWTFSSKPEDEAHIGPTAKYDEVIYPGFQHDITTLQIQGYNISYNSAYSCLKIHYISGRYMSEYRLQSNA